jgi:N-acetylmuramic acid 6-phosphate etherase
MERIVPDSDPETRLEGLATEQRNEATANLDKLSSLDLVTAINQQDHLVAEAVERVLPQVAKAVDVIVAAIEAGGRLVYIGAGTSGRLGVLDASECPPTFNTDPGMVIGLIAGGDHALRHPVEQVEDRTEEGVRALDEIGFCASDVLVGIAASGRTPFVLGAVDYARSTGATTIGLCNTEASELSKRVDITIAPIVGPEVLTGSTRMKAGTAQKMVLNMLTTASMSKLGKTYGNLMVDVQPTNAKLRKREIGIVRDAAAILEEDAVTALDTAGGEVKTAIVAARLGIDPDEARQRLAASGGRVRAALGEDGG